MRIHSNRQLKTLPGLATRPTPARVREAVFNIWQGKIAGSRWLDLCAGSGAMGAEALSRGAVLAVGIEQSARACSVIRQNWQQVIKPDQQIRVIKGDVLKRLQGLEGQPFDRIYFDPPYASDRYQPVIEAIAHFSLLATEGEIAVEHQSSGFPFQSLPPTLVICRERAYGKTALTFLALAMGKHRGI